MPENAPGSMAPKYQRAPKRPRSIRIPNRKKRLHLDLVAIFLRLQTLGEVTVVFFLLDPDITNCHLDQTRYFSWAVVSLVCEPEQCRIQKAT